MRSIQIPSPERVTKAANAAPRRGSRLKAEDYREAILILLGKNFSHAGIARFLQNEGVDINQTSISRYLHKHPPEQIEQCDAASSPSAQEVATPGDIERQQKHDELMERVRKQRRAVPEEDDTDYTFLDVRGRPFRIRPKE